MVAGETSVCNAVRSAMLCMALFAALLLGQNFAYIAAEAATQTTVSSVAPDGGPQTGSIDFASVKHKDCCDHCGQPVAPLRLALAFSPMRPVHATAMPACGCGAPLPHPDKPPRA